MAIFPYLTATTSAVSVRFHEGQHPLLPSDRLGKEAECPGNSWTAPGEASLPLTSSFVNGFQPKALLKTKCTCSVVVVGREHLL